MCPSCLPRPPVPPIIGTFPGLLLFYVISQTRTPILYFPIQCLTHLLPQIEHSPRCNVSIYRSIAETMLLARYPSTLVEQTGMGFPQNPMAFPFRPSANQKTQGVPAEQTLLPACTFAFAFAFCPCPLSHPSIISSPINRPSCGRSIAGQAKDDKIDGLGMGCGLLAVKNLRHFPSMYDT